MEFCEFKKNIQNFSAYYHYFEEPSRCSLKFDRALVIHGGRKPAIGSLRAACDSAPAPRLLHRGAGAAYARAVSPKPSGTLFLALAQPRSRGLCLHFNNRVVSGCVVSVSHAVYPVFEVPTVADL